jgi:plasmid stabilization system protein ParE
MTLALRFRPEAVAQLKEAHDWYESCQHDLGLRFMEAVEACFDQVRQHPESGAPFQRKTRRVQVHNFPYYIAYLTRPDAIVIAAVIHVHSGPSRIVRLLP